MRSLTLRLDDDVMSALDQLPRPLERAAMELIVIELYRRRTISGGRAAELLGMTREEFIDHAADLDIPYFALPEDDWNAELDRIKAWR